MYQETTVVLITDGMSNDKDGRKPNICADALRQQRGATVFVVGIGDAINLESSDI